MYEDGICSLSHEGQTKRGSCEIASCLHHYLSNLYERGITEVDLFAMPLAVPDKTKTLSFQLWCELLSRRQDLSKLSRCTSLKLDMASQRVMPCIALLKELCGKLGRSYCQPSWQVSVGWLEFTLAHTRWNLLRQGMLSTGSYTVRREEFFGFDHRKEIRLSIGPSFVQYRSLRVNQIVSASSTHN